MAMLSLRQPLLRITDIRWQSTRARSWSIQVPGTTQSTRKMMPAVKGLRLIRKYQPEL